MKFVPSRAGASPKISTQVTSVSDFFGCDFSSGGSSVDPRRSPNCENMVRSSPGRIRKRMGFYRTAFYEGEPINGHFKLAGYDIVHAGTSLYATKDGVTVNLAQTLPMADHFSVGRNFNERLYLLDGEHYYAVSAEADGLTLNKVSAFCYIPRISINKNPDGTGGYAYEDINLLSDAWTESFYVGEETAEATVFQLTLEGLDDTPVVVKVLQSDGSYAEKVENTDFTVNRLTGTLTFTTAPGKSPLSGADNVFVTASKDRSESRRRIESCDVCTTYGESGTRLFVTGSPDFPNRDFWSAQNDLTYFSDLSYSVLGEDSERIVGYSIIGDRIAAHKSGTMGAVYVRTGSTVSETDQLGNTVNTFAFKTGNVITGHGAIASHSFVPTDNEPLFLSSTGVFALTSSDVSGERYVQSRSYFLNPKLLSEAGLNDAYACLHKDFYVLTAGSGIYILDLLQKSYEKNQPYSTYQYEGYYWTGVPARVVWDDDGELYFGTQNGEVCAFHTDTTAPANYSDTLDGEVFTPVYAQWETPDIDGKSFYMSKHFRYIACRLTSYVRTSVTAAALCAGIWVPMIGNESIAQYFDWSDIDWQRWTWNTDTTSKMLGRKLDMRNLDKIRFRFSNSAAEPFGLEMFAVEYRETKKHRG